MTHSRVLLTAAALVLGACTEQVTGDVPSTRMMFAKAASSGGDTPVTTTVADADASVAATLQIRSDGGGTYQNSSTLTSVIQAIGAWVLDSYNPRNATRRVYLDFGSPVGAASPVPSGLYKVHMISKCNLHGNNMLTLAPGVTMACPLHVAFDYSGSKWAVQMNPTTSSTEATYPETNYANVTCTAPASGTCTAWRITPSGAGNRNVGKLLKYITSKGTTTTVDQGDFYFSFAIGITKP